MTSESEKGEIKYRIAPKAIHQNLADARHLLEVHEFNLMSPDDGMFLAKQLVDITHCLDRILERTER